MGLSIEQIEFVCVGMKEDLQRRANQGIMRKDFNRALEALTGIGTVDDLLYRLRIRDGSLLGIPKQPVKRSSARSRRNVDAREAGKTVRAINAGDRPG